MYHGRRPAVIFALGVVAGSTFWGLLAAFGLSAVMARYSQALIALKMLGGLYLLWLAFKSAKSTFNPVTLSAAMQDGRPTSAMRLFSRGAAMHITNPKAIFVWLSIVALALPVNAHHSDALLVVAGCVPIGIAVFCSYAIVFSTAYARSTYVRMRRYFDGALAAVFAYAGVRMLASQATV
jgi:threonine/homoserine/homoserine lactone efflux protein